MAMSGAESFVVRCPSCDVAVPAESVGSYEVRDDGFETTEHLLLKCKDCSSPFLARRFGVYTGGDSGWDFGVATILFPAERTLDSSVPETIAKSYQEAATCAGSGAFTACAIMCRRTLEAICAHHGVVQGSLDGKLKKLRDDGIIEQRLFEWADSLRSVGNEAAHDVAIEVSKEDSRDLLDFTRALVEYIFTFTENFKKFKERRAARTSR
jgi:hypothetical protein